jgi:hypothetical protein
LIADFVNRVEEGGYEITLNLDFLQVCVFTRHQEGGNFIVQVRDDGLRMGLSVSLLIKLVSRVDAGGVVSVSTLRKLTMEALRHRKLLVKS